MPSRYPSITYEVIVIFTILLVPTIVIVRETKIATTETDCSILKTTTREDIRGEEIEKSRAFRIR